MCDWIVGLANDDCLYRQVVPLDAEPDHNAVSGEHTWGLDCPCHPCMWAMKRDTILVHHERANGQWRHCSGMDAADALDQKAYVCPLRSV